MVEYTTGVVSRSLWQLWQIFGITFVVAYLLQYVGALIRRCGAGRFGHAYWYVVAPGVVCHETGHAMGCFVTGTKLLEFVPFHPQGNTLGYITHESRGGLKGSFANVMIATGPIWFGCVMIVSLTALLVGNVSIARWGDYFTSDAIPSALDYSMSLLCATLDCYSAISFAAHMLSFGFWLWFYLVFCIASEIGLSSVDLKGMRSGLKYMMLFFFLVNLVPPAGKALSAGVFIIMPYLFRMHVLMVVALGVNIVLCVLLRYAFRLSCVIIRMTS